MTGQSPLDGAILAVSFFNTILLLWLGLTVLLNAEHRSWGIRLAGGGLLMGAAFLAIHSTIFAQGVQIDRWIDLGWHVGWLLVIILPLTWYLLTLWYAGFWDDPQSALHHRQRPWLPLVVLMALALVGVLVFSNPFPAYSRIVDYESAATPALGSIPLVGAAYPLYIVLCICLSLDVLRRPAPSGRMMGDLARRRARPWLAATSLVLLAVSSLVAWIIAWVMIDTYQRAPGTPYTRMAFTVAYFDLIIDSLVAAAILLLGQAVVSYEVFTGHTLPRRGLSHHWRSVALLAAGYGAIAGATLAAHLRPIYGLLLVTLVLTGSYAVYSRRSFAEREQYMAHLRPFVASLGLYEQLLASSAAPPEVDVAAPFRALVEDLLGARLAYLAALGPLAALAGPPLAYPTGTAPPPLPDLAAKLPEVQGLCVPVDPVHHAGAAWAVPLWGNRGLIGVLLLGDKGDGSLYTQEEIEIARASGERLIDTLAATEMARRLMALQRQRLAESHLLDRRTRRVLHDDILPQLHAAILSLSAAQPDAVAPLADAHRRLATLLREMPADPAPDLARLGLAGALGQVIEHELEGAFAQVSWAVEPEAQREAQAIPAHAREVLFYAAREVLRNAAHHARAGDGARRLHLRLAISWRNGLEIRIEDNGVGLALAGPGSAGSRQGLALHSTMMAVIGGSLAIESEPGAYTRATLSLPRLAW